jgi:hypothetical protein
VNEAKRAGLRADCAIAAARLYAHANLWRHAVRVRRGIQAFAFRYPVQFVFRLRTPTQMVLRALQQARVTPTRTRRGNGARVHMRLPRPAARALGGAPRSSVTSLVLQQVIRQTQIRVVQQRLDMRASATRSSGSRPISRLRYPLAEVGRAVSPRASAARIAVRGHEVPRAPRRGWLGRAVQSLRKRSATTLALRRVLIEHRFAQRDALRHAAVSQGSEIKRIFATTASQPVMRGQPKRLGSVASRAPVMPTPVVRVSGTPGGDADANAVAARAQRVPDAPLASVLLRVLPVSDVLRGRLRRRQRATRSMRISSSATSAGPFPGVERARKASFHEASKSHVAPQRSTGEPYASRLWVSALGDPYRTGGRWQRRGRLIGSARYSTAGRDFSAVAPYIRSDTSTFRYRVVRPTSERPQESSAPLAGGGHAKTTSGRGAQEAPALDMAQLRTLIGPIVRETLLSREAVSVLSEEVASANKRRERLEHYRMQGGQ